jgi:hypothetical protein
LDDLKVSCELIHKRCHSDNHRNDKKSHMTLKTRPQAYLDFMHEFWVIPTTNLTYTRLQNYANVLVGEHGIQTFEVVTVM